MKLVAGGGLYHLLYAGLTFADDASPAERIAEYMVSGEAVPANIRHDSGVAEVWRDYQQLLADLGFLYSTTLTPSRRIKLTPGGIHLIDNPSAYTEILTTQVLRFQYPNGAKRTHAPKQIANGVLIRPAVLVWRVVALLQEAEDSAWLDSQEIRDYLMRCRRHSEATFCVDRIRELRRTGVNNQANGGSKSEQNRNALDWTTLLGNTLLFDKFRSVRGNGIRLSAYAIANFSELNEIILQLEDETTFWMAPAVVDDAMAWKWFTEYGSIKLEVALPISEQESEDDTKREDDEREVGFGNQSDVKLHEFDPARLNFNHQNRQLIGHTIETAYDAQMAGNKHRLHDMMVILIAEVCRKKGAQVFEDSKSLDLLVRHEYVEYLVEVKTVTPRNYVKRLRYAVGQLYHYDFMLEQQEPGRRKVIAFPSLLPDAPGFLPFFNGHLNMDVLSLKPDTNGQVIHCSSLSVVSKQLFTA